MSYLKDKKILLGVTGSIAAYKAAELVRSLRSLEAQVKVVMTDDAVSFISPLTLQALSGDPVYQHLLDPQSEASMSHISLAKWADLLIVAPATANVMAKFAAGIADDLLSTLYLACAAPTAIVPAMNQQMWLHPATVGNKDLLLNRGVLLFGPNAGEQACGDIGPGRMLEPEEIIHQLEHHFAPKLLSGMNLLITAGPTREAIDPVRYLSNYSSGKMGYALARAGRLLGATVTLISGPTRLSPPLGIETIFVDSASDMYTAVLEQARRTDILISAAAIADYRCREISKKKLKSTEGLSIEWEKTPDILQAVSALENPPFLVGFAAESENLIQNAMDKLRKKNLDMIIANLINAPTYGFDSDFNQVTVVTSHHQLDLPHMDKFELARQLLPMVLNAYQNSTSSRQKCELIP